MCRPQRKCASGALRGAQKPATRGRLARVRRTRRTLRSHAARWRATHRAAKTTARTQLVDIDASAIDCRTKVPMALPPRCRDSSARNPRMMI
jgi:hypothetical protein